MNKSKCNVIAPMNGLHFNCHCRKLADFSYLSWPIAAAGAAGTVLSTIRVQSTLDVVVLLVTEKQATVTVVVLPLLAIALRLE
jgi:hypothetical protein